MNNLEKAYKCFVEGRTLKEKSENPNEPLKIKERIEMAQKGCDCLNEMNKYLDKTIKRKMFNLIEQDEWERAERVLQVLLKENGITVKSVNEEPEMTEEEESKESQEAMEKFFKMLKMTEAVITENERLREENKELRQKLGITSMEDIFDECVNIEDVKNGKCVSIDMGKLLNFLTKDIEDNTK